jgi:DNA-binding transcriptional MerR regulator/methylmalonyl-CoA mutase cobalamin-binding subunit
MTKTADAADLRDAGPNDPGHLPEQGACPPASGAHPAPAPLGMNIASVERDTGLSKDTLRVWERRYGFPVPGRDALGERLYPLDQVFKLRTLKRLLDLGHRPGRIVGLPIEDLQRLAEAGSGASQRSLPPVRGQGDLDRLLGLLTAHRFDELRGELSQLLLRHGLARFITDVVAPMNERVGEAWTRGTVQIFEEHLYTEAVQGLLRSSIGSMPRGEQRPRVLLTTFPQEPHGLGVLMAEATFALEGCHCVSLGVQTPVWDIALAAESQRADIVALSFSAAVNAAQAMAGLAELRAKLPEPLEIWAGGGCPALHRRPPPGVVVLRLLDEIAPALQRWRQARVTA